jgi:ribokinase
MSLNGGMFLEAPGGKGANAAVAAARLGARTALIGRVGDDVRGRALLDGLTLEGVHAVHVSVDDGAPTGAAVIQVDEQGQKQILAALGANLHLSVADIDAAADTIRASRTLVTQLEVPLECVSAAVRIAMDGGVRVVFDPAPPRPLPDDLLKGIDVMRANATEAEALTDIHVHDQATARKAARAMISRGVRAVIVEAGRANLLVWEAGDEWIPELPATCVDTTGAGDAFAAGLAVALAEGRQLPDAARFASAVAARATSALGPQTSLPRRHELDPYLDQTPATHSHR